MATNPTLTDVTLNPGTILKPVAIAGGAPPTQLTPANPTLSTSSSSAAITVPNTSGTVTFQLVVTDNLGVQSAPVTATVTIQSAPVAKLTATPVTVGPNGTITLSGAGSTSSGSIANFAFTLQPTVSPVLNTVVINPATGKP